MFADNNGDYPAWTPKIGHYVLKATPYVTIGDDAVAEPSYSVAFSVNESTAVKDTTISDIADAYVRDGSYVNTNFGSDTTLQASGSATAGSNRRFYLKFPLNNVGDVVSAKLRIYGRNTGSSAIIPASVYGIDDDGWLETTITSNNAPAQPADYALGVLNVNNQRKYYEVDVSDFVKGQFAKDKSVSFLVKDTANKGKTLSFNSRENVFFQPQLIITTSVTPPASNASMFVENLDKFPSNNEYTASHLQVPWSRDGITYNTNHDTLRIRINNKGINPLTVTGLNLSNKMAWKIVTLQGVRYSQPTSLPITIASGSYADVQVKFLPQDSAVRIRILTDELTITSNDDKQPVKTLILRGLFQREGEGSKEPKAGEIISAFGFKTKTGFPYYDPDKGANNKPKGDQVLTAYFVRVDQTKPVTVRQMSAYHGCCDIQSETLKWYPKGSTSSLTTVVSHVEEDAQSVLPRRNHNLTYAASEGSFSPTTAFGFKVGSQDWMDTLLNVDKKIGIRVLKAIDSKGQLIPNAYIISNDYLGTSATNYDYNDNMYFVTNVRPELGPASTSALTATPSAVDFGEQLLQSNSTFSLSLQSLGQQYGAGVQDPSLTISNVAVVGQNASEFSVSMPQKTVLASGETTSLNIGFKPQTEGLKVADLLIYYNNGGSPLRVPLYGIGKATGTIVSVPYRIKSGSSSDVIVNGKTYVADTPYAFDNLEPFSNAGLTQISATDDDALYLREQSSNNDKRPFRYEIPLDNGTYWVRLHFAEIYWGNPGSGVTGGAGSRVMSVMVEGEQKLINLDVAGEVGSAAAVVKVMPVTVVDGKLNINFSATVNRPMVCAIEVYQFGITAPQRHSLQATPQPVQTTVKMQRFIPIRCTNSLRLNCRQTFAGNTVLQLADAAGRSYDLGKTVVPTTGSKLVIDVTNRKLTPGIYFLNIRTEKGQSQVIRLLVQ